MANLNHQVTVSIPFGSLHTTIEWCQKQLEKNWQFHIIEDADHYTSGLYLFLFESDKDLTAFMLWQKIYA